MLTKLRTLGKHAPGELVSDVALAMQSGRPRA